MAPTLDRGSQRHPNPLRRGASAFPRGAWEREKSMRFAPLTTSYGGYLTARRLG